MTDSTRQQNQDSTLKKIAHSHLKAKKNDGAKPVLIPVQELLDQQREEKKAPKWNGATVRYVHLYSSCMSQQTKNSKTPRYNTRRVNKARPPLLHRCTTGCSLFSPKIIHKERFSGTPCRCESRRQRRSKASDAKQKLPPVA